MKADQDSGRGKRILISEDSSSVRDMLTVELSDRGYNTVTTKNGKEAFDLIEKGEKFDLLLCDVEIPQMDGLALTCAIRNRDDTRKLR
ncbi:MAG: response regulator [candidate division Zixibacteria bacterium]|nr:response regulator [candidate division Zixibacteria bacterium]